ncbi:co-chaperone GroES [Candidatus Gottesmanbacteria bacterium]|nr:co-chaperone GroES [Candidatus Gottesmanbacteria bacterium]
MATVKVQPLFDNVLIKPLQQEEKLPSGIVLPDSAKEKPQVGLVMAVGTGAQCNTDDSGKGGKGDDCCGGCCGSKGAMVVKVGQKVMYKKWGGNEVKVNGEEWMIVEQKDILAIVE